MRAWLFATTTLTAACGFTPAGDLAGADLDAADLDAAAPGPDAGAIDARPVDARPPIDAAACPASYGVTSGGGRYGFRVGPATVTAAAADCDDDLPGRTHLATFENRDLDAVLAAVGASSVTTVYVGGRCDGALDCDVESNWFWQGSQGPVDANLWSNGEPSGDLPFTFAQDDNGWGLVSSGGTITRGYLCECDP